MADFRITVNQDRNKKVVAVGVSPDFANAFAQANAAMNQANVAIAQANIAITQANIAINTAEYVLVIANAAIANISNTVPIVAVYAWNSANAAFERANLAYELGNTVNAIAIAAFNRANISQTIAISSYGHANGAYIVANQANNTANTALPISIAAYGVANIANNLAQATNPIAVSAYNVANQANNTANTALPIGVAAYGVANQANNTANTALPIAISAFNLSNTTNAIAIAAFNKANNASDAAAFGQANAAYATANIANNTANIAYALIAIVYNQANAAYDRANVAYVQANDAYNMANVGPLAYNTANSAIFIGSGASAAAAAAHYRANVAFDAGTGAFALANTINVRTFNLDANITAAFDQANSARQFANVANNTANITFEIAIAAFTTANAANGTTVIDAFNRANTANVMAFHAYAAVNTVNTIAIAAFNQANTANATAIVAFGQANAARDQANTAYNQANTAFITANQANTTANTILPLAVFAADTANSANLVAISANIQAIFANTVARAAFGQANAAAISASQGITIGTAAFVQANTSNATAIAAFSQANTVNATAIAAFNQANVGRDQANTAYNQANTAYNQANTAYNQANTAYNQANAAYSRANAVNTVAIAAYGQSNLAYDLAVITRDAGNVINITAIASFNRANIVNAIAIAAFIQANTANNVTVANSGIVRSFQPGINFVPGANIIISAVEDTTNKWTNVTISSTGGGAGGIDAALAFDQANSANLLAKSGYDQANAAYAVANLANNTANTTLPIATAAFLRANTANNTANIALSNVTFTNTLVQSVYGFANSIQTSAIAAYDTANNSLAQVLYANSTINILTANINYTNTAMQASFNRANIAQTIAIASFSQSNAAYNISIFAADTSNSALVAAAAAASGVGAAFDQANTANASANAKLPLTGGTITGNLRVDGNVTFNTRNVYVRSSNTTILGNVFLGSSNDSITFTGVSITLGDNNTESFFLGSNINFANTDLGPSVLLINTIQGRVGVNTGNLSNGTFVVQGLISTFGSGGGIRFPDGTFQTTAANGAATDTFARITANTALNIALSANTVTVSNVTPVGAPNNVLWFNTDLARPFIKYDDGNTAQWIEFAPQPNTTIIFDKANAAYNLALMGGGGGANVYVGPSAPGAPSNNQLWWNSDLGRPFIYYADSNSTQWVEFVPVPDLSNTSNGGASVTISDSAPSSPSSGDMWWNSSDGNLYVYYNDGTSSQWVEASPSQLSIAVASEYTSAAFNVANQALAIANVANGTANNALAQAIWINVATQAAFAQANLGGGGGAAYDQANAAYDRGNIAWTTANQALVIANTANNTANNAWIVANQANATANLAFANLALYLLLSGGTLTGKLTMNASTSSSVPLNIPVGATPSAPADGDLWYTSSTGLTFRRSTTDQRVAFMDQINAWGQGATQQFQSSASFPAMRITPRAGDPGTLGDGDFWYNSTVDKIRVRMGGATQNIATNTDIISTHTRINLVFDQANAAYVRANTAWDTANQALVIANVANGTANTALSVANAAAVNISSLWVRANQANQLSVANTMANSYAVVRSSRTYLNFIPGGNVAIDVNDDSAGDRVNVVFNVVGGGSSGDPTAAFNQANAAYDRANIAWTTANQALVIANVANGTANQAMANITWMNATLQVINTTANNALAAASAAYAAGNTTWTYAANTVMSAANSAYAAQNTTYTYAANTVMLVANAAFSRANLANLFWVGNTATANGYYADRSYTNKINFMPTGGMSINVETDLTGNRANIYVDGTTIFAIANSAYTFAANDAMRAANSAYALANSTWTYAANTVMSAANSAYAAGNTTWTYAANTVMSAANAAFDRANIANGTANTALSVANAAAVNISSLWVRANQANQLSVANTLGNGYATVRSTRTYLNFVEGGNVSIRVTDDSAGDRINVSFDVPAGSGGGGDPTAAFNRANDAYTFAANDAMRAANSAYALANSTWTYAANDVMRAANSAYAAGNTTYTYAANTVMSVANAAFDRANIANLRPISNTIQSNGYSVIRSTRNQLNFLEGGGIAITIGDDATGNRANVTISGATIFAQANAAYTFAANDAMRAANSAYALANSTWTYAANDVMRVANSAFAAQNTTYTYAANTVMSAANAAFASGNSTYTYAANTVMSAANSAFNAANIANLRPVGNTMSNSYWTVRSTRNRLNFIPGTNVTINVDDDPTLNTANITISASGTGGDPQFAFAQANAAYDRANLAWTTANTANNTANNAYPRSGGTISGDVRINGNLVVNSVNTYVVSNNTTILSNVSMGSPNTAILFTGNTITLGDGNTESFFLGTDIQFANTETSEVSLYINTIQQRVSINTTNTMNGTLSVEGVIHSRANGGFRHPDGSLGFSAAKTIEIPLPVVTDNITFTYIPVAVNVRSVRAVISGTSTPNVGYSLRWNENRSLIGNEIRVGGWWTTNTTHGQINTNMTSANINAGSWLWVTIPTVSGTVNTLALVVTFDT